MRLVDLNISCIREDKIPQLLSDVCPPNGYAYRMTGFNRDLLEKAITKANLLTKRYPQIGNDLGLKCTCQPIAQFAHSLEHCFAIKMLEDGEIPFTKLETGDIAMTVPITTKSGTEGAVFLVKKRFGQKRQGAQDIEAPTTLRSGNLDIYASES